MAGDYVIGVDSSTTAAKAVVWNPAGLAVSSARSTFELSRPRPGWGEQNAEDWWAATAAAVRRAVQTVDASRVGALCVTHQRETFVCLDAAGNPLRPALLWLDGRAVREVEEHGTAEVHRITGKPPNPTPAWYKLLWLARHEPETVARTGKVVDVQGFLVHRLTGEWATSWASADPLGLVDMTTCDYDDGLLAAAGLRREQLGELRPPGTVLGRVADDVARELGLPRGLPVVAGVGDGQAAQLGTGVTASGRAYLNLGTGVVSGTYSETYSYGAQYRTLFAAVPGAYALETFIGGGTYNLSWFVEKFSGLDSRALGLELTPEQILETAAAQLPPGADGLLLLPYWAGALTPYWDHHARGVLVGLTGSHGKSHVYRALLEGIAYEQRLLTDGAEAVLQEPVSTLVALGGGSRSRVWCQILADVMRRRVDVVREAESTCLGAGMLAAAAVGVHDSVPAAAEAMSATAGSYEPDAERCAAYDRLYAVYRDIYPAMRALFPRLAEASRSEASRSEASRSEASRSEASR
ncbi:FGGY-family carbohydrate kinase [Quadrisphaera sp. DSM 44207]|uniref:xylulokinase n=1 Tax=Quadrisphaera sp. DSM 44207 TaxID=1881057 RepID=UPI000887312B|nr:FGGY family carbohydrate kinase [Quadrisphaera sp. DSM 44207]SDQ83630.1 xylulokinase [Quadrisphaera sp. DSM 44207]